MFWHILFSYLFFHAGVIPCNGQILLTQTVYGFLDFTTTIGNTVMVFSPQSSSKIDLKQNSTNILLKIIDTEPLTKHQKEDKKDINPSKSILPTSLKKENTQSHVSSKKVTHATNADNTTEKSNQLSIIQSNVDSPEYDLLSREPQEFVEESFRVINIKSSLQEEKHKNQNSRKHSHNIQPIGLVTKISSTFLKNGLPAIHETSVLGTYISGKYAQILQTTSIIHPDKKAKHRSSSTMRVLKTATPSITINKSKDISSSRQNPHKITISPEINIATTTRKVSRQKGKRKHKHSKTLTTVSNTKTDLNARRAFRTKSSSLVARTEVAPTLSQYSFKLNRRPGRWQYKTSPKPKVVIKKYTNNTLINNEIYESMKSAEAFIQSSNEGDTQLTMELSGKDLEASGSQIDDFANNDDDTKKKFVQTLNVEISTPDQFSDTYYEIATIKSPFIFQAGAVKKTRFVTVTSTLEKIIKDETSEVFAESNGPLTENILETFSTSNEIALDGSITTMNAIHISENIETPKLDTITESFTHTKKKLKTKVLPFINDIANKTILATLVHTYDYTTLITITRTVSPLSSDNNDPQNGFKDFEGILDEAGSEINLDLEFGDEDNADKPDVKQKTGFRNAISENKPAFSSIENINHESEQLALFSLLAQPVSSVVTLTHPVIKVETIWESHIVPLIKGTQTLLRTLSKSIGTIEKTVYTTATSVAQFPVTQNAFSFNPYINPLLTIPPQQQVITSSEIYQTTITQTNSKVLKLTFGAKTAFTTIYSTEVIPTMITSLITTAMKFQPSVPVPFQNYFPPFGQFPFVG